MTGDRQTTARRQTDDRQTTDKRQTDENGRPLFSFSNHKTSKKHESGKSPDGLDYYTSLVYAEEVKKFISTELHALEVQKMTLLQKIIKVVLRFLYCDNLYKVNTSGIGNIPAIHAPCGRKFLRDVVCTYTERVQEKFLKWSFRVARKMIARFRCSMRGEKIRIEQRMRKDYAGCV